VSAEPSNSAADFITGVHGVRYQVKDVSRAADFYVRVGFAVKHQQLPAFAALSFDGMSLLLSGPGASGSRPLPTGEQQEPGGWNRIVLRVTNLRACIDALRAAGCQFRNELQSGPGGSQIQLLDPDGNPIELFEPAR
jgi:glyoxylase I family protein